ncbi:Protein FAM45A [Nymphon striatum]|nr:Protein FAM45A [Nymphon striatum]KAG1677685.1 Protein FAM45A [Nymphon striatum]
MSTNHELKSIGLIERDSNNDVLWTWSYPSISNDIQDMLMRKCGLSEAEQNGSLSPLRIFFQYNQMWYYVCSTEILDGVNLPKVKQFFLILVTKDFNPEKHQRLGRILSKSYSSTGSPASILQLYLSVITRGSCSTEENGTFLIKDYDQRLAFASVSLKNVINTFGLETILIYTAIALKKKIVVYHHKMEELLAFVRALPALMWHRQNWSILFPLIDLVKEDLNDLSVNGQSHYVAGFNDASIEGHTELYDIFVNLAATEISIAPHAKENFSMSKTHKDIALFMVRSAENEDLSEAEIIKEISSKTRELINNIKSLGTEFEDEKKLITLEGLKERKLAPATENFLFNFAVAENLVALN